MKSNIVLGLESSSSRMSNLARQQMYFGRFFAVDEIVRRDRPRHTRRHPAPGQAALPARADRADPARQPRPHEDRPQPPAMLAFHSVRRKRHSGESRISGIVLRILLQVSKHRISHGETDAMNTRKQQLRNDEGFTLIELLIVMSIIAHPDHARSAAVHEGPQADQRDLRHAVAESHRQRRDCSTTAAYPQNGYSCTLAALGGVPGSGAPSPGRPDARTRSSPPASRTATSSTSPTATRSPSTTRT